MIDYLEEECPRCSQLVEPCNYNITRRTRVLIYICPNCSEYFEINPDDEDDDDDLD